MEPNMSHTCIISYTPKAHCNFEQPKKIWEEYLAASATTGQKTFSLWKQQFSISQVVINTRLAYSVCECVCARACAYMYIFVMPYVHLRMHIICLQHLITDLKFFKLQKNKFLIRTRFFLTLWQEEYYMLTNEQ